MNILQPAAQSARTKDADGTGHTLRILKCAPCSCGCGLWAWGRVYNIQMIFRVRCRTSQEAEVAGSREIWHVGRGVTRVMLSYTTPMQCSAVACLSIGNLNLPVLPSCLRRIWRVLRSHETRVNVTIPVTHVMTSVTRVTRDVSWRVSPEQTWADQHQAPRYQGHQISFH